MMKIFINPINSYVYSGSNYEPETFLFQWNSAIANYTSIHEWAAKIMTNGDVIFVWKTESKLTGSNDYLRKNPIVYEAANEYTPVVVDLGIDVKPTGWMSSTGALDSNGNLIFCEYTRPSVEQAILWKVIAPFTNPNNWFKKVQIPLSGLLQSGFKHWHCVQKDDFTGVIYATTGDDDTAAIVYYSMDDGDTFTVLYGPSEMYCRLINYVFTEDWIYWVSDTNVFSKHYLFKAPRSVDGSLDYNNIVQVQQLPDIDNLASYYCVLLPTENCLLILNRFDGIGSVDLPLFVYDLTYNTLVTVDSIASVKTPTSNYGFRVVYVDTKTTNNKVLVGFSVRLNNSSDYTNYLDILDNTDSLNVIERVNSFIIEVARNGSNFDVVYSKIDKTF